jgi:hypothetical protein
MKDCKHERGDFIDGIWVCADCFRTLDERPKRYALVTRGYYDGPAARQEIAWEAPIAVDSNGIELSMFVGWMIRFLRARTLWTLSRDEARRLCLEVLRDQGEPYGGKYSSWFRDDAKELVREGILCYFDDTSSGRN